MYCYNLAVQYLQLTMVFSVAFMLFSEQLCWFPLFMVQKKEKKVELEVSEAFQRPLMETPCEG